MHVRGQTGKKGATEQRKAKQKANEQQKDKKNPTKTKTPFP